MSCNPLLLTYETVCLQVPCITYVLYGVYNLINNELRIKNKCTISGSSLLATQARTLFKGHFKFAYLIGHEIEIAFEVSKKN